MHPNTSHQVLIKLACRVNECISQLEQHNQKENSVSKSEPIGNESKGYNHASKQFAFQAVVKMFRILGEDKEYGVIKIGAVFPNSECAQGRIPFFYFFALLRTGLSVIVLRFLIVLGTWIIMNY